MKDKIIPEKFQSEYQLELGRIFYYRVNLFCYVGIFAFLTELILGATLFKNILNVKDMPGVIAGTLLSILLLITGRVSRSVRLQRIRAFFLSFLMIMIAILAAKSQPRIMPFMGISLVLMAFFMSVLLLPWTLAQTLVIGAFTLINFVWVYRVTNTFIDSDIFGINRGLLAITILTAAIAKRSEDLLRRRHFAARKETEEKSAIMAKELELANRIHKSIMPHSIKTATADIAVTYKPMLYMGGDYAKFHFIDDDKIILIVADVTGHGVSSALLVNRVHAEIERLIREKPSPGEMLKSLDDFINEDFGKLGYFLSAFCGLVDFSKAELIYSNYGHPPQILIQSRTDKIVLMEPQTFMMGIGMQPSNIYTSAVSFKKGDRLMLFTDGIIEAKTAEGEFFGEDRLEEFAKKNISLGVVEFNNKLVKAVEDFQAGPQTDDIFLLTIQTF